MIKVGDELPQGILRTKTATIHELKTDEMFSGKKLFCFHFQVLLHQLVQQSIYLVLKIYIKIL